MPPEAWARMKRVWKSYVMPQWKLLAVAIFFMILFGLAEAYSVMLLRPVYDEVFIEQNREILYQIAIKIIAIFAIKGFAFYFQAVTMAKLGVNFVRKMQGDLYDKIVVQDLDFFHKKNSGEILVYFLGDLGTIRDSVLNGFTALIKDTFSVIFLVGVMFWASFEMAIVMFVVFPIAFYPIAYFGKKVKKIFAKQQVSFGQLFSVLSQSFQGIKIVKSYNMENAESVKVRKNADDIANIQLKMARNNNVLSPLMEFFGGIGAAATIAYGGMRIMQGQLTTGQFMVFMVAIVAAYKPMKSLASLNLRVQAGIAALDRVFSIMDQVPQIRDCQNAKELEVTSGEIKLKNVEFNYVPDVTVLDGISMEVKKGEKVAIVGAAGSGKSTVINLLLRFYEAQKGLIEIDGQDVKTVTMKSLRDKIALVSQDVVLFDDTVKNNILMGSPDATDEDAIEASKHAAAHGFITKLEHGYDTLVGERGSKLSGGQKQMISIARAMLKNAPILLLDEATSSLDSKSERMVQEGLEKLMHGRTSIVIAHRLSTIINADKIYVFEGGHIVEGGSHKELLAKNGYYSNLYKLQFMQD